MPAVDHAEPVIDGERAAPVPVRYQILCCPKCGGENTRVTSTQRPIRHHKCKDCGQTFKTVEERQQPALMDEPASTD